MARQKGLTDFKLALIRYLMRLQGKKTPALAEEIEYSVSNLSKVLNRQSTGMRISAKCVYRTFCLIVKTQREEHISTPPLWRNFKRWGLERRWIMANIVSQCGSFNCYLDGKILLGDIEEVNVPDLEILTINADALIGPLNVELKVRGDGREILEAVGKAAGKPITLKICAMLKK